MCAILSPPVVNNSII